MKTSRIVLGCILASLGFLAGGAGAQVITEFSAGITAGAGPAGITAGADGNLWFTEPNIDRIGRITPAGVVTEFSAGITAGARPYDITAGPDGNLWFTESGRIGRITPAGVVTEFSTSSTIVFAGPLGITAGPDGNLWYTKSHLNFLGGCCLVRRIGRITPDGVVTEFGLTAGNPSQITAGPDGNLWFTEVLFNRIGRITPSEVVTEFSAGLTSGDWLPSITAGPDGNLWFTKRPFSTLSGGSRIGRIDPLTGTVTEFSVGLSANADPTGITAGPDGHLWFTEQLSNRIGRIDPLTGTIIEFSVGITGNAGPSGITTGPDGNLWFTEPGVNRIGRITACLPEAACSPSITTVVSSLNPSHVGLAIVFTASVVGNFPTGTVQFIDGGTPLGSPVTLSGGGVAQIITSTLTRGSHSITAVYSGDDNNAPSTSSVLFQRVGKKRKE